MAWSRELGTAMTTIRLNGEPATLPTSIDTVAALLVHLDCTHKRIAVELNQQIVAKSKHAETALKEGDVVEVVQAIGGG